MIRVLFVGDIVGRLGRQTVQKVLPDLKKRDKIDLCLANGENLAGGRGLTAATVLEVIGYGVDYLTGGDHTFWQKKFRQEISNLPVIRPMNLEDVSEGYGSTDVETKGGVALTVVSLLGTSSPLIREKARNPFLEIDEFLSRRQGKVGSLVLIDFHAEASSEKVALGWFVDGRVSALFGTHTHVPTADQWILPGGTAYVTDVGMVGSRHSVLGVKKEIIIERMARGNLASFEWVRAGAAVFNSVLVTLDEKTGRALAVERRDFNVDE